MDRLNYYKVHLDVVNAFLPVKLTDKEREVLAAFMSLEGQLAEDRFGKLARAFVRKIVGLKPQGMYNYIKAFEDKKCVINGKILPVLMPEKNVQEYNFKLIDNGIYTED